MLSRFFIIALLTCAACVSEVSAQAAAWTKYSSPEGRFSVMMPVEPMREEQAKEARGEKVVMRFFTAGSEKGIFIVAYTDYRMGGIKQELDANRDSFLRGMKATLVSESDIKLRENPGREIRAERDGLNIRSRIFIVGTRYYQVVAITPATFPGNLEADKFLNSFELLAATAVKN